MWKPALDSNGFVFESCAPEVLTDVYACESVDQGSAAHAGLDPKEEEDLASSERQWVRLC